MSPLKLDGCRSMSACERPLVSQPEFVIATRDTGYRSLAAAVAELVDNSIQAKASQVQIFVRCANADGEASATPIIAVMDNGQGMNAETISSSVQFGGTERFNDRTGFGRFGMGLPNSSVSIARRVDVYSWQQPGRVLHTYLDIDEVVGGRRLNVPAPGLRGLPAWAQGQKPDGPSGTLVVWSRCDRLELSRPSAICERLRKPLGRIYRKHIWLGLRIALNEKQLQALDPLFHRPDTGEGGATPYGDVMAFELATSNSSRPSRIEVRFTELPIAQWHSLPNEHKRDLVIVGGAGVSFMRAGREIDFGWHLMGSKRRENYDDWWRCEVSFSPELDELFGVTHSKQGVTPTTELRAILEPNLEAVARRLNGRARAAFAALLAAAPSRAAARASKQDRLLPALPRDPAPNGYLSDALRYRITAAQLDGREFMRVDHTRGQVTIILNTDHPFHESVYRSLAESSERGRFAVECLLLAAGRAVIEAKSEPVVRKYIDGWSDALAAFLDAKGNRP
jgi:hypothetical protein